MDIKVIDNFISEEDSQAVRKYILDNENDKSRFDHAVVPGKYRIRSHVPEIHSLESHAEILPVIKKYGQKFVEATKDLFNDDQDLFVTSFFFTKMGETTKLGKHRDNHDGGEHLFYSAVIYLNDDYEGGEIKFSDFDFTYKPKANSIIIFRSSFVHYVEPVVSGIRQAIPIWITLDPNRKLF